MPAAPTRRSVTSISSPRSCVLALSWRAASSGDIAATVSAPRSLEALSHHWLFPETAATLEELGPSQVATWIEPSARRSSTRRAAGTRRGTAEPAARRPSSSTRRRATPLDQLTSQGARGARTDGARSLQRPDRRRAVHRHLDGQDARQSHPAQARARPRGSAPSSSTSASTGHHAVHPAPAHLHPRHDAKSTLGMIPSGLHVTSLSAQHHHQQRGGPWSRQSQSPTSSPPP